MTQSDKKTFSPAEESSEKKRPVRVHGERELTMGLINAIDTGIIKPNAEMKVQGRETLKQGLIEFSLPLSNKVMGMATNTLDKAKALFLSLDEVDLEKYREKTNLTIEEMRFSLLLLKHGYLEVSGTGHQLHGSDYLYTLRIFDVASMSEYEMRKIQIIVSTNMGNFTMPENKLARMERETKAYGWYLSEIRRLEHASGEIRPEVCLHALYTVLQSTNVMSDNQIQQFHFDIGHGMIAEIDVPQNVESWEELIAMVNAARSLVEEEMGPDGDITALYGLAVNAEYIERDPKDVTTYAVICDPKRVDYFLAIPMELWYKDVA